MWKVIEESLKACICFLELLVMGKEEMEKRGRGRSKKEAVGCREPWVKADLLTHPTNVS